MSYNDGEIKTDDYPQKVSFQYDYLIEVTKENNIFIVQYPPDPDGDLDNEAQSEDLTKMYPFTAVDLETWEESCTKTDTKPIVDVSFTRMNVEDQTTSSLITKPIRINYLITAIEDFFSEQEGCLKMSVRSTELRF